MKQLFFSVFLAGYSVAALAQDAPSVPSQTQQQVEPQADPTQPATAPGAQATPAESAPKPEEATVVSSASSADAANMPVKGTWVNGIGLNDILAILVRKAGYQYFDNPSLNKFKVSGNLLDEEKKTVEQLEEIVFPYNLTIYRKGDTLYALTLDQVKALPRKQFMYSVKYLRAGALPEVTGLTGKQTKSVETNTNVAEPDWLGVLRSVITPDTGLLRFESQTGTLVVIDQEFAIERVKSLLEQLDQPRRQVVVKVQILRLNNNNTNYSGVDWSQSLGKAGTQLGVTIQGNLNQIFADVPVFGDSATIANAAANAVSNATGGTTGTGGTGGTGNTGGTGTDVTVTSSQPGIVISPIRLTAVLRALQEANLAKQEAGPTIITEDRMEAVFRVVDRIPIVEQTVTQNNGVNNISTNVRYYIDSQDPINDPANSREVGVRIAVTPQLLPGNLIRLDLAPYVATVTSYTTVQTGVAGIANEYPNVNETAANTSVRIPDGYSLLIGGYYQWAEDTVDNKVPLLGDIPILSFAFRSKQRSKVRSNVIFIITPTAYDPISKYATTETTERVQQGMTAPKHMKYPDDEMPGENTEPNLFQRIRNMFPGKPKRAEDSPLSPDYPANQRLPKLKTAQQVEQEHIVESFVRDENGQLQPVRRPLQTDANSQ
jgi:type II secretory pathway component GspD/PulD (secretin)